VTGRLITAGPVRLMREKTTAMTKIDLFFCLRRGRRGVSVRAAFSDDCGE